jgi:integrase
LLDAPPDDSIKLRVSTLLFHALRRQELCTLKVRDFRRSLRVEIAGMSSAFSFLTVRFRADGLSGPLLTGVGERFILTYRNSVV